MEWEENSVLNSSGFPFRPIFPTMKIIIVIIVKSVPYNEERYEPLPFSHQFDKSTDFIIKTQNNLKANAEMVYTACCE